MPSASGIRAGLAYVEIVTKDNKLIKGLAAASQRLQAFGKGVTSIGLKVTALGTAAVGGLLAMNKSFTDAGGQLADMSQRTGISVEALSALGFAAEQSGTDLATLEGSVRKMQAKIGDLADGNDATAKTFKKLGLSLEDMAGKNPDEQFVTIADAISQIKDPALRTSLAMDVFGKSGTALLPMFANGAAGINELVTQARELGLVWDGDTATAAEGFGDVLDVAWKVIKKVAIEIGAALVPDLKALAETITSIGSKTIAWVQQNRELIAMIGRVAAGVLAGGVALVAIGAIISGVGAAIGAALAIFGGVGTALATVGSVIAAILSPIGLVVAAVVGLGGYFLYASGVAGSVATYIQGIFSALASDVTESFGAIGSALAAGDIAAAAKVLWALLKMEWQKGINWINAKWEGWKTFFINVFNSAVASAATFFTNIWAGVQVAFIETTDFMSDTFSVFASFIKKTWNSSIGFIKKRWTSLKSLFVDIDVDAEMKRIDEETAKKNAGVDDDQNKTIMDRENKRKADEQQIERNRAGAAAILEEERARKERERATAEAADIAASNIEVENAKREWQEAVAAAKKVGANAPKLDAAKRSMDQIPDPSELMAQAKDKTSVAGTFSSAIVGGLGTENMQTRIAAATEKTAKNTAVLVKQGPATFTA